MSELLVEVTRGEIVESVHRGDLVVIDFKGNLIASTGDPNRVMFARSSAKPLQALPLLLTGAADSFQLSSAELALACASHSGEPEHTELVQSLLARLGLSVDDLRCGVHAPYHQKTYETMLKNGQVVTALHNNCSGKHTGMLALAKFLNAPLDTYDQRDNPVQEHIFQVLQAVCEIESDKVKWGVDGCGVPVFAMPIHRFALLYAKLAESVRQENPQEKIGWALKRLASAMMDNPKLVAGSERLCTDLMMSMPGKVVAKAGAEGVYCVGWVEKGIGLCLKIDDGNSRAVGPVVIEALCQLQLLTAEEKNALNRWHRPSLVNHSGTLVGEIRPAFELQIR